ncbi:protein FAF-like, chloroplastic [Mangifera indica]|uniref:protein FAF-like, chloroplastic n=1 Tax=Mangifera indica TaxID=29780 RepID=UPI001CFAB8BA|nr:protein FAF-like, chloroplastic [Mangifera indica]
MSAPLSKSLQLASTLKIEEEAMVTKTQGIGSILGSDSERSKSCSLRRTLSADMSSTKWITQHGLSPMKKIASSKEFTISSITDSSEGEEEEETELQSHFHFWSLIQEEVKEKKEVEEKPGQFDIWSSIISQKAQDASNKSLPPPYVHPLVKRKANSLTKKSLEICTESLGSETGSDGFSSYPSSETGDTDDDKEMDQEQPLQQQQDDRMTKSFDVEEVIVPKYNYAVVKKSPQPSFPPPISSLSYHDGASIRMQSRRDNGRLVLEAVSVPSTNNFRAQRQDGRLVLTFVNTNEMDYKEVVEEKFEEEEEGEEEEEEEDTEEEEVEETENENKGVEMEIEFMMDQEAPKLSNMVLNVRGLTLVMNKQMGLAKTKPTWANKFNEVVKFDEVEYMKPSILAQSLPPPARMARLIPKPEAATVGTATGATFNAYEYYWRPKPMAAGPAVVPKQKLPENSKFILSKNKNSVDDGQKQVLLLSGKKGDYLLPLTKSCKDPRRSLLFWEPYCIATS